MQCNGQSQSPTARDRLLPIFNYTALYLRMRAEMGSSGRILQIIMLESTLTCVICVLHMCALDPPCYAS